MALTAQQQAFVDLLMPHAITASQRTGVDPRIIVAQAAQETGWGQHAPNNNYFGIKSHGQAGGSTLTTFEYENGQPVTQQASFRGYASPAASVAGYADFLLANPRYRAMMQAQGFDAQIAELGRSGYATDPNYASSVGSIARSISAEGYTPIAAPQGDGSAPAPQQHASLNKGNGGSTKTPAPNTPPPTSSGGYTVKSGDTLWDIAERELGDGNRYMEIARASGITDPNRLDIGQQITIPGRTAAAGSAKAGAQTSSGPTAAGPAARDQGDLPTYMKRPPEQSGTPAGVDTPPIPLKNPGARIAPPPIPKPAPRESGGSAYVDEMADRANRPTGGDGDDNWFTSGKGTGKPTTPPFDLTPAAARGGAGDDEWFVPPAKSIAPPYLNRPPQPTSGGSNAGYLGAMKDNAVQPVFSAPAKINYVQTTAEPPPQYGFGKAFEDPYFIGTPLGFGMGTDTDQKPPELLNRPPLPVSSAGAASHPINGGLTAPASGFDADLTGQPPTKDDILVASKSAPAVFGQPKPPPKPVGPYSTAAYAAKKYA